METGDERIIKVRVNASGKRTIGYVHLPPDCYRISDIINGQDDYLVLRQETHPSEHAEVGLEAILNDAISYVEALEEVDRPASLRQEGRFHPVTAELKDPIATLQAELFIPKNGSLLTVLNGARRVINLRNVRFLNSVEKYSYLAVGKRQVIHLKA